MEKAPSWLRAEHADDQLLASVLELAWTDLRAVVALATRDRNLQNKARWLGSAISKSTTSPSAEIRICVDQSGRFQLSDALNWSGQLRDCDWLPAR